MAATIDEHRLGSTPWLVVSGERASAFRLLGEHQRDRIHALADNSDTIRELRAHTKAGTAAHLMAVVREQSRAAYPSQWSELVAMAAGANIPLGDLLLLNLRGDVGSEEQSGCTDVAFRGGDGLFLAHNEDGAPEFELYSVLLTLRLEGEPSVTAWWYPGFLPSNTFSVNQHGLIWGIDNIRVTEPAIAPGRHFVGRALQRCATIAEAADHLRRRHSAGGFTYTIGQIGHPHAMQIETAGGNFACRGTDGADGEMLWHTNHLRYLPSDLDAPLGNSFTRAKAAGGWSVPHSRQVDWCLQHLAYTPMPDGVRRDATGEDPLVTLVTFVVNLSTANVTVAPRGQEAITIPADDFAAGRHDRQSRAQPERPIS